MTLFFKFFVLVVLFWLLYNTAVEIQVGLNLSLRVDGADKTVEKIWRYKLNVFSDFSLVSALLKGIS
jgi:hypothetical protein